MPPLSVLQPIAHPIFSQHKITVQVKRDDLIHRFISGNKWRKLKYNLLHAKAIGAKGVITFGGCFSNHIHACSFACHQQNLPVIGIIRGEQDNQNNYTLAWAKHWAMKLTFVDRKTYRMRNDEHYLQQLQRQYPDYFIIPEGGSNALALTGVAEVIEELSQQCEFDTLITPVGSGGTLAGLILGDKSQHNLLGIAVLKQQGYLESEVSDLLPLTSKNENKWRIAHEFHCGGYAKFSPQDAEKIRNFSQVVGIDFEPVYSGKMILALLKLIESGYFPAHHRIVLLHTGGLQGLGGMFERGLLNQAEWPSPPATPVP
ncbi:1-aminocyclopropane-1-carboxylate deaminase/D-cysteine desulfhydrase [Cognaticolwellia beringensis]|uniref:Cysteine desulfhydrase n=1 Tax=Cognaticolwellia beringensis TaxID=1967665 RepID=A0A222G683_9GAMM|nr:pyridoxal-phosphate dependent enzyme [Cognaticolwellia beringensis]ASP47418.1 cysteine desulfhydrase [Cognaticolwellia beringensis]